MKPLGEGSKKVALVTISDSRVIAGKGARRYAMQNGRPSAEEHSFRACLEQIPNWREVREDPPIMMRMGESVKIKAHDGQ